MMPNKTSFFSSFQSDGISGIVVFLVALPLCLGIAVASGAPPFAGIISGVIGGLVVGYLSKSHVSVSGPAAGLIVIVYLAIQELGLEAFLMATVLAGIFQLLLGFIKAGTVSNYFPSAVIEGMLTGIGIIIIKKELPHAIGYRQSIEGDFFHDTSKPNSDKDLLGELLYALDSAHAGIALVALLSIVILVSYERITVLSRVRALPAALVVVLFGIFMNELFGLLFPGFYIEGSGLVDLPVLGSFMEIPSILTLPDWTSIFNTKVWIVAMTIAAVASIETLLCLEAGDKMDPMKRYSDPNVELKAQGVGNILAGCIGGLPMTSVIVRTTANIKAGARTKLSAIFHGLLLLLAVLLIPGILNKIPMASLAAILIMIGYKLASPAVFKHMWRLGRLQFIPFMVTVLAVVFIDLLKGVGIGLMVSIYFILNGNMKHAYFFKKELEDDGETIRIDLAQEVSFLNKAVIKKTLSELPAKSKVVISAKNTVYIDYDVLEVIKDFSRYGSKAKNIHVELLGFRKDYMIDDV